MKILLAVDGSKSSLDAVKLVIDHAGWYRGRPEIELLNVHPALPKLPRMSLAVSRKQVQRYYREEGEAALDGARKLLDAAAVAYRTTLLVGNPANAIVKHAKAGRFDLIVVGNAGRSGVGNLLIGSVASKVLHLSEIPVMLVR